MNRGKLTQSALGWGFFLIVCFSAQGLCDKDPLASIVLKDVDGKAKAIKLPGKRPQIIILGNRECAIDSADWGRHLTEVLGDEVEILSVAEIKHVPTLLRSWVSRKIAKEHGRFILLDWEGSLSGHYGLSEPWPHILLYQPNDPSPKQIHGVYDTQKMQEILITLGRSEKNS